MDELSERETQAVRECVRVYANTAYFRPAYREAGQWMREAAAAVAAPLLGLARDELLAHLASTPCPRRLDARETWANARTTTLILRAGRLRVAHG